MLYIGFDPAFIDTLVRLECKDGNLLPELPIAGFHHRMSKINRIAGGNGTNVSSILTKLGIQNTLVVPCNPDFELLLKKRVISDIYPIEVSINETVALTYEPGEIQFNHVRAKLGFINWTKEIHEFWQQSDIQVYLNWGLNPLSHEWVSCQWLASCGWSYDELIEETDRTSQALEATIPLKKIILEPGSIKEHNLKQVLTNLLEQIASTSYNEEYPILCCNEEEATEYQSITFQHKIVHTDKFVDFYRCGERRRYKVEPLTKDPETFVGAGDAFLAGIIQACLKGSPNIKNGIKTAQSFLSGDLD
ncbi:MAG: hypothetical protein ACXAD7_07765 [Candidatus Kariarchaeaceae archaeon]|jgi:fructose-1-phosphate kinase PfkB-like protein